MRSMPISTVFCCYFCLFFFFFFFGLFVLCVCLCVCVCVCVCVYFIFFFFFLFFRGIKILCSVELNMKNVLKSIGQIQGEGM